MIALAGALGLLHLPQQGIHLGQGQAAMRVDGRAAGQSGQQLVFRTLQVMGPLISHDRRDHFTQQGADIGLTQQCRHTAHCQTARRQSLQRKAGALPLGAVRQQGLDLFIAQRDDQRFEQRLGIGRATGLLCLELFVEHPLMTGMHVDQHQPVCVLRQDVDAMQLRQRLAQGPAVGRLTRCHQRSGVRLQRRRQQPGTCHGLGDLPRIAVSARQQRRLRRPATGGARREHRAARITGTGLKARTRVGQQSLKAALDKVVHAARLAKAQFLFLRVGVDVHLGRFYAQVKYISRMPAIEQHIAIGHSHRVHQQFVAHRAAIDEPVGQVRLRT